MGGQSISGRYCMPISPAEGAGSLVEQSASRSSITICRCAQISEDLATELCVEGDILPVITWKAIHA